LYKFQNNEISVVQFSEQDVAWGVENVIREFMYLTCDIIKIKFKAQEKVINQDQIKFLSLLAAKVHINDLFECYHKLIIVSEQILSGINFNQQLLVEDLLINWLMINSRHGDCERSEARSHPSIKFLNLPATS
jgi:hypothetical protein